MKITPQMETIRSAGNFIPGTVHWSRRKYDGAFEIVGRLTNEAIAEMRPCIGGEVVLHVSENRKDALDAVRFFRNH